MTRNLGRFAVNQLARRGPEAQIPGVLIAGLFEAGEDEVSVAVCGHHTESRNPAARREDFLAALECLRLVTMAPVLHRHMDVICPDSGSFSGHMVVGLTVRYAH